ncbi:hypothetical protein PSTG_04036 [Puccinia striiformis f. sp. tritici PST-78]|uniref:Velvet domain-containing protein n=1 Tax=Puccinia striiformis f. sp. tritici PST-78 TaxID=1165861 RepID=A0A0L0VU02_9BASI|nr:hypothetical protein PSTG_04036 [Puccinia striiformis f. sp. tritici PST-78]
MANQISNLNILQQPKRGIRFNGARFPEGRGQTPVMPVLLVGLQAREGVDINTVPLETYRCILQLFNEAGTVRLPDPLFSGQQQATCQLVPSMDNPNQIQPLFIFGEIVIRDCGVYRLRVGLHALGHNDHPNPRTESASIMTDSFDVVEYELFPGGANILTPLTHHLINNGIILHVPPENDNINWDEGPTTNGTSDH